MTWRPFVLLAAFLLASTSASPPTSQRSPDQLFDEIRRQLLLEHQQSLKDLPDIGDQPISNLIALRREGDLLEIIPKLAATNEAVRFILRPRGLMGKADFRALEAQKDQVISAQIELIDFSRPGDLRRDSSIFVAPQTLNISTFVQRTTGDFSVQFLQSFDDEQMSVRLIFQETGDFTGDHRSMTWEAGSFSELRRKHGREVQRHLAPILRDAGLEQSAFAPPLQMAQQALGVGAAAETSAIESLEPILSKLDSPDFRTRHKAAQELQELDPSKVLALAQADRKNWSLDRIAAVDALLANAQVPSAADVSSMTGDPMFLIDCLYLDDPAVRKAALKKLEVHARKPLTVGLEEKIELRVLGIDRLVDQLIPPTRSERESPQ